MTSLTFAPNSAGMSLGRVPSAIWHSADAKWHSRAPHGGFPRRALRRGWPPTAICHRIPPWRGPGVHGSRGEHLTAVQRVAGRTGVVRARGAVRSMRPTWRPRGRTVGGVSRETWTACRRNGDDMPYCGDSEALVGQPQPRTVSPTSRSRQGLRCRGTP